MSKPAPRIFDQSLLKTIMDNLEIFKYEYPEVGEKNWTDFKNKPQCKCRKAIFETLKADPEKLNRIFSKLLSESVEIFFPAPIDQPIVKEFETLVQLESFLKELKAQGKIIRSATPSPNGKGGFLLIVL